MYGRSCRASTVPWSVVGSCVIQSGESSNWCSSFLFTILIKPQKQLLQGTKATLYLILIYVIEYIWVDTFLGVLQQLKTGLNNVVYSLNVLLGKKPREDDAQSCIVSLSPVNMGVWWSTQEAVTVEPSALRSGLQQICTCLTASELVCSLFPEMNVSSVLFQP